MDSIIVDGNSLTIAKMVQVARFNAKVILDEAALKRILKCREMLEKKIEKGEVKII